MRCGFLGLFFLLSTVLAGYAEAAESRLEQISKTKTIKIAHRTDATPFSFVKNDEVTGYTIDICKFVVQSLERRLNIQGLKTEWVPVTTQTRFDAVTSGKADMECGASTVTLGRMKQVEFSSFIFVQSTGLVAKTSSGVKRAADLTGKKIAVISGTTNEQAVTRINETAKLKAVIVPVKDRAEGVSLLESGGADAFAGDKILLAAAQYENPQGLAMLPDDLSLEPYAIVLPLGDGDFRLAVNAALADFYRRGAIMPIYSKWFSNVHLEPGVLLEALFVLGALPE